MSWFYDGPQLPPPEGSGGWLEDDDPLGAAPELAPLHLEEARVVQVPDGVPVAQVPAADDLADLESEESEPTEDEIDPEEGSEGHEPGYDYDHVIVSDDDEAVEIPAEEDAMDIDGAEEEPDEDPEEEEPDEDPEEEESEEDSEEEESDEDSEEEHQEDIPLTSSDESEAAVDIPVAAPRGVIIRGRDEPLPPPGYQVYRDPCGIRWMHTPRKRVPAIQPRDVFRARIPVEDVPAPPPRPEWAALLLAWCLTHHLPPPFGQGQRVFDLTHGSIADRALPAVVGQITSIDTSLTATRAQLQEAREEHEHLRQTTQELRLETTEIATHMHGLAAEHHEHQHLLQTTLEDVDETRAEIQALRDERDELRERVEQLEAQAEAVWEQAERFRSALDRVTERLDRSFL